MSPDNPLTAVGLLGLVQPFGPAIEGGELTFATDPPSELELLLAVLHTGVRAILSQRKWWATVEDERAERSIRVSVIELGSGDTIPPGTTLLCVEDDRSWDRVHPDARLNAPRLFANSTSLNKS